ncbi:hypothetical protein DAQ1742_04426 [Dickeya aquatica]|uniref:Uncharacterized protein n=1 Tax=Dickeya aquatica TaxID=1401087 RepID=A0A375AH02_9GAMM|nr:hypothetical protein DAQ1742_04426 [Dickeya aquatica]
MSHPAGEKRAITKNILAKSLTPVIGIRQIPIVPRSIALNNCAKQQPVIV